MSRKQCLTFRFLNYRLLGIVPILVIGLLASGCGKKTFPRPIVPEPPPQVKDLRAEVRGGEVQLSWSAPKEAKKSREYSSYRFAVMKYELPWDKRNCLECPAPGQKTILTIDPAYPEPAHFKGDRLVVTDNYVSPGHAYRYQLAVMNQKGREVSFSNPTIASIIVSPRPPEDFVAVKEDQGILLKWRIPKKNILGKPLPEEPQFNVERRLRDSAWESISPAPVKGDTFFDPAVASNEIYEYRVFSYLSFEGTPNWSEPSAVRQIKAPGALPPPPPSTVWAIPAKGSLEVNWTPSEGKVSGYHVYRRQGKEIVRLTLKPVQNPPYIDRNVKPNEVYFYAVSAVGANPPYPEGLLSKWAEIRNVDFQ